MFLVFDTETGGLHPERNALLTVYMGIVNDRGEVLDEKDWLIQSTPRHVETAALAVNKIDLDQHNARALPGAQVAADMAEFLYTYGREEKLTPLGYNINFDIRFITAQLIPPDMWNLYVSHHTLDVMPLARMCLDGLRSYKLTSVAEYLEIPTGTAHTARADAHTALAVYNKLKRIYIHGRFD